MMKIFILTLLCFAVFSLPNQRPIIGIYTQSDKSDQPKSSTIIQTYIAASYIKFVQMSGAQVVPIFSYSDQSYIDNLLPKLNGVLFPGGGVDFDITSRWTTNANRIFQYAMKQNDKGNVFPIWGTCMGHQLLAFLSNDCQNPLFPVRGQLGLLNPIKFVSNDKGYVFSNMPQRLITKLTTGQGISYFNHHWAISRDTYDNNKKLNTFWKLIAETTSSFNEKFVSVWQARKYPFYSVQFHPQKSLFEWKVFSDKSYDSVEVSHIMANRFIEKARQSKNQYASQDDFEKTNIYNYNTYSTTLSFTRIYLFNETMPGVQNVKVDKYNKDSFNILNNDDDSSKNQESRDSIKGLTKQI